MNKTTILIVEDERAIIHLISTILSQNGYDSVYAMRGAEATAMMSSYSPDLVLLDLGLPDMDGLDVLRNIRRWSHVPVIVVSAREREREKVAALDLGADDYIVKPFGTQELLARIRTALRHHSGGANLGGQLKGVFTTGQLTIDYDRRLVTVRGQDVHLTQNEYKILTLLSQYVGRVLTYDSILKAVWGSFPSKDNQILRVNMANIRRKIELNPGEPQFIITEVGVGYRMIEDPN